jgi:outer membrane PBP1 activator LpoA protein
MPQLPTVRRGCVLLAALTLAGCPSLSERAGPPPSVDRAAALEQGGDAAGAARVYEALAAQNIGAARNELLLHAGRDYLAARRSEDAARALAATDAALPPQQSNERALLNVELAIDRGQREQALRELHAIP